MSTLSVRRPLALLAVLGMVAALLFAVVGTASAADPANAAEMKACPDNASIPDPGFTDTAGLTAEADIDCIAYYGVTTGTSPTTYSPKNDVLRWQMALFLTRMATSAGVVLDPTPDDAGFTDIGHLPAARQLAINQLVEAGIVKGTSPTTYSPDAPVIRGHMALFLTRFLGEAITGPGGTPLSGAAKLGAPFTDIGHVSHEQFVAINELWDLVITTGTTPTTYSPSNIVKRDQMASFMTRLMNHANSRPEGVNLQAYPMTADPEPLDAKVAVTSRDADFKPVVNTLVDAWGFIADDTTTSPFVTAGTCDPALKTNGPPAAIYWDTAGGNVACELQATDRHTNTDGNIEDTLPPLTGEPGLITLYAWTGAVGSMFNVNSTVFSTLDLTWTKAPTPPDDFTLKTDLDAPFAEFGDTVTWTAQLVEGPDETPVALAGVEFKVTDSKFVNSKTNWGVPDGIVISMVTTDASGVATYSLTVDDPGIVTQAVPTYDEVRHQVEFKVSVPFSQTRTEMAYWKDEAPKVDSIKVTTPTEYLLVADPAPTPNSVTVLVLDQYGAPFPNATVKISSGTPVSSLNMPVSRHVDASGSWTEPYTWKSIVKGTETLTATSGGVVGTSDIFIWATKATDADNVGLTDIEIVDVVAKTVVGPNLLEYTWGQNSADHYSKKVGSDPKVNTDEAGFAALMKVGNAFSVSSYSPDGSTGADWGVRAP